MKKSNEKILISLLLALVLIMSALTLIACDDDPTPPADSESSTEQTPGDTEDEGGEDLAVHNIIENGVVKYAVIRAESATKTAISAATSLYQYFAELSSEMIRFETDYTLDYLQNGTHDETTYEIVIGNTIYEYSAKAYEGLGFGDWRITTHGNKIYVAALADDGIVTAINWLLSFFRDNYNSETSSLSINAADIEKQQTFNTALNSMPFVDGVDVDCIYDCGDSSKLVIYNDCTEDVFDAYLTKLKEQDYKEYTSTVMNNNKFATYSNESGILNVSFTPSDKKLRVIFDSAAKFSLPEYDKDWDSSKKVCDSLLIQIGTAPEDNDAQNGECYLIRCEDGRFLIWDGGFKDNESGKTTRNNHVNIYNALVKYTPAGQKPTIAAWIFTHGHTDHIGACRTFMRSYSSKVDIEQFVYNFPSLDESVNTYGPAATQGLLDVMNQYYAGSELVKAHPGQLFKYANVEIEMLYSLEFYAPKVLSFYNTSSLVNIVRVGGQSIMMSGDMSPDANDICRKYYGDYLKCDFYQVSHHGGEGGSNTFNKLCDPKWVLWPRGANDWDRVMGVDRNSYLTGSDSKVEILFPAWFQTTVINLPFDGNKTSYEVYPNK